MNPLTDKITLIAKPDGTTLKVIQPGALVTPSSNWRMTRELYDRYAPYLEMAVNNWPKETKFSIPEDMSPNTFCARFRDARKALLLFHYDLALEAKLRALDDAPVISMDPDGKHVWFRERGQQSAPNKVSHGEAINHLASTPIPTAPLPPLEDLHSICKLMSTGALRGPLAYHGLLPPPDQQTLESLFDIAFILDPVKQTTTLI